MTHISGQYATPTMKIDFKRALEGYKAVPDKFEIINIPDMQYLMVDGHGDPNTSIEFTNAIQALYPVAYKLKFASKVNLGKDYTVMPLEGLWWSDDMAAFTTARDKSKWDWTMMIMQPDWITNEMFEAAIQVIKEKSTPASLDKVRLEHLHEGLCVQTLYVGAYDNETETLLKMHNEFVPNNNLVLTKKHHEIYLSDLRKTDPDKLKTILRQPVARLTRA